jgi:hypothetical protein
MRARSEARRAPRLLAALALALLLAAPSAPVASPGDDDAGVAAWQDRLERGRAELAAARERAEQARDTYQDWRQRKVPRGVRKEALVREMEAAEAAAAEAEAAFAELREAARRAGVPPGVLRRFEEEEE